MPIRVAIVEDDLKAAETLQGHLERYGQENGLQFKVRTKIFIYIFIFFILIQIKNKTIWVFLP